MQTSCNSYANAMLLHYSCFPKAMQNYANKIKSNKKKLKEIK
jgi:hypothetical protein